MSIEYSIVCIYPHIPHIRQPSCYSVQWSYQITGGFYFMQKHIIDEKTGISYTLQGDYYIPDLTLPPEKEYPPLGKQCH